MFELSKVTYSQTTKGKDVLVDAHYFEYVLNKVDGITWYWECRYRKKEKCRDSAISDGKTPEDRVKPDHSHRANIVKTKANIAVAKTIKESVTGRFATTKPRDVNAVLCKELS